jgi:hypothetical protein
MWGFETLIHKLYIQDHFHEYSCKQSTNDMPFCIITYPPPPIFHSVHCDGVKNMKFVNAQQAKEIVPVKKKKKRLYNTNTW